MTEKWVERWRRTVELREENVWMLVRMIEWSEGWGRKREREREREIERGSDVLVLVSDVLKRLIKGGIWTMLGTIVFWWEQGHFFCLTLGKTEKVGTVMDWFVSLPERICWSLNSNVIVFGDRVFMKVIKVKWSLEMGANPIGFVLI